MYIPVHCGLDARMSEQLLQDLWLHAALNGSCGICMPQGMNAYPLDSGLITQLVQMCVIGAVLDRLPGPVVDKDQIAELQLENLSGTPIQILEHRIQHRRFFTCLLHCLHFPEQYYRSVRERNCPITVWRFRRTCTPFLLLVAEFQRFIHRQRTFLPVNAVPGKSDHFSHTQPCLQDQRKLMIVVRVFCRLQKGFLLIHREIFDIICRFHWLGVFYSIHRMSGKDIIVHSCAKHRSHRNVRLPDRTAGISLIHTVENQLAVHGLHIRDLQLSDHRPDIVLIPLPVIAYRIRCQIRDDIANPEIEPVLNRHLRIRNHHGVCVFIFVPGILQPVLCLDH